MNQGQGSLEYLIIISLSIAILAVVTSFVVGYFSTQSNQFYYTSCSTAASLCKNTLIVDSNNECAMCDNACNYSDGTEIFAKAVTCCKLGKTSEIYSGSPGCMGCSTDLQCTGMLQKCCDSECKTVACKIDSDCPHVTCSDSTCSATDPCNPTCVNTERATCFTGFAIDTSYSSGRSVAIGDADDDGVNEIVFSPSSGSCVYLYENKSGGWPKEQACESYGDIGFWSVAVGDANNDTKNEIVASRALTTGGDIIMLKNVGGTWIPSYVGYTGNRAVLTVGDANNDGTNEVAAGVWLSDKMFRAFENVSNAWTQIIPRVTWNDFYVNGVVVTDSDQDGENEIVYGTSGALLSGVFGWQVVILENKSGSWPYIDPWGLGGVNSIDVGDVNDDGAPEIVALDSAFGIRILKYDPAGPIEQPAIHVADISGYGSGSIKIGDIDEDGVNEIVEGINSFGTKPVLGSSLIYYDYDTSTNTWEPKLIGSATDSINAVAIGHVDSHGANQVIAIRASGIYLYYYNP